MARFQLNKEGAAMWLDHAMAHADGTPRPHKCTQESRAAEHLPDIGGTYAPRDHAGDGGDTHDLVRAALLAGIITDTRHPEFPQLRWELFPYDGEHVGYQWFLDLGQEATVSVTDGWHNLDGLGFTGSETTGANAALAVLAQAVSAGNHLVDSLARYIGGELVATLLQ